MPICPLQLFLCSCEASLIWQRLSRGGLGMVKLAQPELTFFVLPAMGSYQIRLLHMLQVWNEWRTSKAGKGFKMALDGVYLTLKQSLLLYVLPMITKLETAPVCNSKGQAQIQGLRVSDREHIFRERC